MVDCISDAVMPILPDVYDNCGNMLTAIPDETIDNYDGCEGTITYPFTYTDCEGNSHDWSYTYNILDDDEPTWDQTMPADMTIECNLLTEMLTSYTATDNCDEDVEVQYSEETTELERFNPYTLIRTWTATDNCDNSITHIQTINVQDNTAPIITCPDDIISGTCMDYTIELPVATDNCDEDVLVTWNRDDGALELDAPFEVGQTNITFTATDNSNNSSSCSVSVTIVPDPQANMEWAYAEEFTNLICGEHDINTLDVFVEDMEGIDTYEFTFSNPLWHIVEGNSGIATTGLQSFGLHTEGNDGSIVTLIITGAYDCTNTSSIVFEPCISESFCSHIQGFYGDKNGISCGIDGYETNAYDVMSSVMNKYKQEPVLFGLPENGWELYYQDITENVIFNMLPGNGNSAPFNSTYGNNGVGTYKNINTWQLAPLKKSPENSKGKISNNLFAQALTFFFNMEYNNGFGNLEITGEYLITADAVDCGSNLANGLNTWYTEIPESVVNYLNDSENGYDPTALGLFNLANDLLGGSHELLYIKNGNNTWGISHSDVTLALDAFNVAFDGCRIFIGFMNSIPYYAEAMKLDIYDEDEETDISDNTVSDNFELTVHPNPFRTNVYFNFISNVDTYLRFEIYSASGALVEIVYDDMIISETDYELEFSRQEDADGVYFYKITTNYGSYSGKLVRQK
jgi:hypothetical protein